jgi:hypothetical protein
LFIKAIHNFLLPPQPEVSRDKLRVITLGEEGDVREVMREPGFIGENEPIKASICQHTKERNKITHIMVYMATNIPNDTLYQRNLNSS